MGSRPAWLQAQTDSLSGLTRCCWRRYCTTVCTRPNADSVAKCDDCRASAGSELVTFAYSRNQLIPSPIQSMLTCTFVTPVGLTKELIADWQLHDGMLRLSVLQVCFWLPLLLLRQQIFLITRACIIFASLV